MAHVSVKNYGKVEAYDAEAIHSGRALPMHPASRALEARHQLLLMLTQIFEPLLQRNRPRKAKGAWWKFIDADFEAQLTDSNSTSKHLGIGYLPSFTVDVHVEIFRSHARSAQTTLQSLFWMPSLWKSSVTNMGEEAFGHIALHDLYYYFDKVSGLRLLAQQVERLANAPAGESCSSAMQATIESITWSFRSNLLQQIEHLYFGSPELHKVEHRKYKTASKSCEHDQVSGLLLGLIRSPADSATILTVFLRVVEKQSEMKRLPHGMNSAAQILHVLDGLLEDSSYYIPNEAHHHIYNASADDDCLAARFFSWISEERPLISTKQTSQRPLIQATNMDVEAVATSTHSGGTTEFLRKETFMERLRKPYVEVASLSDTFNHAEIPQLKQ